MNRLGIPNRSDWFIVRGEDRITDIRKTSKDGDLIQIV